MRLLVSAALIIAWAMPALTATIVWQWMFDTEYGLVNWALDRQGQSWFANQLTFFMIATIIVVWMGIPFVAFTVYAALTQIPEEIIEAARIDGARFRDVLRYVSFPALKPILLILTSLSVIWDFRVFTQIYVLQNAGGITRDTNLLGVFAYRISIGENRFDIGAAVAVVMVADHGDPDGGRTCGPCCGRRSCERARALVAGSGSGSTRRGPSSRSSPCSPCTGWCCRRSSATASSER